MNEFIYHSDRLEAKNGIVSQFVELILSDKAFTYNLSVHHIKILLNYFLNIDKFTQLNNFNPT